jgi:ubiquinone/menaquinone biosynthesis C-methylase UbiE
MKKCARLLALLAFASGLLAQVASQANSGYRTEAQRAGMAKVLGNPQRDGQEKPGELMRTAGIRPGMTVADVGTGIGFMLPFLSRRVGPEGKVIAEDIFDDFLAGARQRVESQHLQNVTLIKGTDRDPRLPENALDLALALDVYHHFDYPADMLAGIYRALKPDGRLVIVEYYKRPEAMPGGNAVQHIRLDMPDLIKEVEANRFHLIAEKEHIPNSQYILVFIKKQVAP